jgi:hypothetical protein
MNRRRLITRVLVAFATGSTACGGGPGSDAVGSEGAGSCANIAIFEGREYTGQHAVRHPSFGEVLGEARIPACNDTNLSTPEPDEFVKVARLAGVDPEVAIVDAISPEVIYIRSDLYPGPAEVVRLFTAPSCAQEDSPIAFRGTWLGIFGPGETTELDLLPPYTVMMLVSQSSSPRYVNAEIDIRVPPSLGSPLTHQDVKTSLWEGGTIRVRSTCDGKRFVADSVAAFPP